MDSLRSLRRTAGLVALMLGPLHASAGVDGLSVASPSLCPTEPPAPACVSSGEGLRLHEESIRTWFRAPWTIPDGLPVESTTRRASYPIETSIGRVVPTVVYVPDPGARVPGLLSIALERAVTGDPLRLKAEVGWSGRPSGSVEIGYRELERQASFKAEERPAGIVALPNSRLPGSTWEGVWTERLGARTSATFAVAGDRVEFEGRSPEATSGRVDIRLRATDTWNVFIGMAGSSYADMAGAELRRGVTSAGTELNAGPLNLAAVVRDQSTAATGAPGRGGRVTVRGSQGGWRASLYADAQQQANVLELDAGQADGPRELAEAGLVAVDPETMVRLLRDGGPTLAHQVSLGTLRVDPLRVQSGLDLRWRDGGAQQTEIGLLLAVDDLQGASGPRRGMLGQLQMSWRVLRETDLTATYATWSVQGDPLGEDSRSLFRVSVRSRL